MNDMRNIRESQKKDLLAAIGKELRQLEKKHGEAEVRWAMNKLTAERTQRRQMEKEKRELEEKLAELDKKGVAA